MLILYALILLVALQIFKLFKCNIYKYRQLDEYPGPSAWQFFKNAFGFRSPKETFDYIVNLNEVYGPVVKLWIKPFKPMLQVTSTTFVEEILMSKTHIAKTSFYDLIEPYIGKGVGTVHSATLWKKYRTTLNPSMKIKCIEHLVQDVFKNNINIMIDTLAKHVNKPVDLEPIVHLFALDSIFEAALGCKTNFQLNENRSYLNARIEYFDIIAKRIYAPHLQINSIFSLTKYSKQLMSAAKVLRRFSEKVILEKLNQKLDDNTTLNCLRQSDLELSEIIDNINTMLFGGHDTVGTAISFCMFEIANRSEVQQRLFEEISEVTDGKQLTTDCISKLKYLESVVKETLRFYNVVSFLERKIEEDLVIDNIKINAGTMIRFNLCGIHKSKTYFDNPEIFDPERFLIENAHKIRKNTFVAFSVGPRDCIGKLYGMIIVKQAIATILQKFTLTPVEPKQNIVLLGEMITKSINGVTIRLEERNK